MSYTKHNFVSGDTLLASDLNAMEDQIAANEQTGLDLKSAKAPVIIDTSSGAIVSFEDGADGMPIKALTVNVEPVQTGTGDPSPTNVRPISGWTGCQLYHGGKNLIPSGIAVENGYINASGDIAGSEVVDGYRHIADYIRVYPNTAYTISGDVFGATTGIFYNSVAYYDANKNFLSRFLPANSKTPAQFTTPPNCAYIRFNFPHTGNIAGIQLEYGNVATDFDSQASIYPIAFPSPDPGTVYGGTLTINDDGSGELVVDTGFLAISSGGGIVNTTNVRFANVLPVAESGTHAQVICNMALQGGSSGKISVGVGDRHIYWYDALAATGTTTIEEFRAFIANYPLEIVYNLFNPQAYPLTAEQVTTLLGTNNIRADCGDVSVDYPADTKLYIERINAPTDEDMTADTQIASGKYFIIGNSLYFSTTTIPAGDTIIPGTNCTKTDLAAALNALNT